MITPAIMAISPTKQGKLMNPHTRIDHIAALSASVANLSNARAAGAGARNEMLDSAQKLLCQRIEELANAPLMSAPAVIPASPAADAERADIELFLWLRERGLDIVGIAKEALTPPGQKTEREVVFDLFNEWIGLRKEQILQNQKTARAEESRDEQDSLAQRASKNARSAKEAAEKAVDSLIANELRATA